MALYSVTAVCSVWKNEFKRAIMELQC